ncbi:protease [Amycolatopsis deserti]|uniref:Protease n=1 Tax=Amycolatopsis deserti TaxID=185696 RepID=A0ABQ3IXW3_9PSEU|nr:SSI family serine proteinase inhibitor [Amycolatopsis deserti]GHE93269.1 protease [Amycolatopsis deserti]
MPLSALLPAAASVLALAAPPAQAPAASLMLSLQDAAGRVVTVSLDCHPAGGSHPGKVKACTTLTTVDGDIDRIPGEATVCPMIYSPVTATARGHWRGKPVVYTHTFGNKCAAAAESAGVFEF